ncbi:inositol monophosphatase family protein [Lichenifustis flavocetrariae]|uniref:Inositol-1-monophosphatase n=1 Tax=Lichenifustis flavocetrariae TaxID=2949735 RepID=A0AA42CKN8_9HYPH|nr:inositol monophosphatase family protein [Lichenifustis flavocetrariae]MCW6506485.1 inositol monophosphatase [Lichenifustis flavocetrariae]
MFSDLTGRRAVATDAARRAGEHLKFLYADRGALVVEQKGLNDFVSRADREAEAIIKTCLGEAFPDDGFIGEETGQSGASRARVVWVVDPLDGTTNFLKGTHNWCVSIGLVVDDTIVGGVIYDPLRDEIFEGFESQGTRVNGRAVEVSSVADPGNGIIALGYNARIGAARFAGDTQALLATGLNFRQLGAGALMLAYVAAGRIDAYFERHMWPWDAVAGLALIKEAGGLQADYPAGPDILAGSGVLAANPALYPLLKDVLGGGPDPWMVEA